MKSKTSAKFRGRFLLLAACFLMLFSPFDCKAQTTSEGCKWDHVYGLEFEQVPESQYNASTNSYETRLVWKWVNRSRWKCVPIPPETNSTTSTGKKTNPSDSKAVQSAKSNLSLGLRPPYEGQYSGTWVTNSSDVGGQKGEWTLSVNTDGKIKGKEVNTTFDATAAINGFVSKDGHIELILKYGGIFKDAPPVSLKGRITNTEKRHLKGKLNQYDGDRITSVIEIDLAPIGTK